MSKSYSKKERKRRRRWWEHHPDAQPGDGPALVPLPPMPHPHLHPLVATDEEIRQVISAATTREYWRRPKADLPILQGSSMKAFPLDAYRLAMEELQARLEHLYAPPDRRWDLPWLADHLPQFNPGAPALAPAMQAIQDLFDLMSIRHDWWDGSTVLT